MGFVSLSLIFLEVASVFGPSGITGRFGSYIGTQNLAIFGYVGYVYPLFLLYPTYCFYKVGGFSFRRAELLIAFVLCIVALFLLQFLIFDSSIVGRWLSSSIEEVVGIFGVWAIGIVFLFLGIIIFSDSNIDNIFNYIASIGSTIRNFVFIKFPPMCKKFFILACDFTGSSNILKDGANKENKENQSNKESAPTKPTIYNHMDSQSEFVPYTKQFVETDEYYQTNVEIPLGEIKIVKKQNTDSNLNLNKIAPTPDTPTTPMPTTNPQSSPTITPINKIAVKKIIAGSPLDKVRAQNLTSANSKFPNDVAELLADFYNKKVAPNIDESSDNPTRESSNESTNKSPEKSTIEESIPTSSTISTQSPAKKMVNIPRVLDDTTLENMIREVVKNNNPFDIEIKEIKPSIEEQLENTMINMDYEDDEEDVASYGSKILREVPENKEMLSGLEYGKSEIPKNFTLPPLSLLSMPNHEKREIDESEIDRKSHSLLEKLGVFKIDGDIKSIYTGPVVTTFEFRPAPHVKVSRILSLEDDLKMTLRASSIRIQAPIPSKDAVGIEIANNHIETIYLREILNSDIFKNSRSALTIALGKDIVGNPFVTDLRKLPQLLIAGTTGSGKSVGVNAMILSMLYKNSPDRLKLMMIDPKKVEFSLYEDIPHLITPIITDPKKAVLGLKNAVAEMLRRYDLMKNNKSKEIDLYNKKAMQIGTEILPYFVIVIDELADLMMSASKEVENYIMRIAQLGRAAGIHLIVATQRPSVDVVTGIIKANLPARISFRVGSKIDSKVILDAQGAESLVGRGDMLFKAQNGVVRLHAPYSSEEEIEKVVNFIKSQSAPQYNHAFLRESEHDTQSSENIGVEGDDLLSQAKRVIIEDNKTSISNIQRRLNIGYNRAANIVESLEKEGFLSAPNTQGIRNIIR